MNDFDGGQESSVFLREVSSDFLQSVRLKSTARMYVNEKVQVEAG